MPQTCLGVGWGMMQNGKAEILYIITEEANIISIANDIANTISVLPDASTVTLPRA